MSQANNSRQNILLYSVSVIALLLCIGYSKLMFEHKDVAFIDIGKLVAGYQMKKDLDQVALKDMSRIKAVTDSLKMVKKIAGPNATPQLDSQLMYAQYAFEQYYQRSNQNISQKIWERLNPLLEQYGKEKKLYLLIGANGAGTLLYGDKKADRTEELLQYLNNKYEKGN